MFMFIVVLVFVLLFFIEDIFCMIMSFLIPHVIVSLQQNSIQWKWIKVSLLIFVPLKILIWIKNIFD